MKTYHVFLKLVICFTSTNAARILGVFPMPSISHQVVFRAVMKELHSRGHHVVAVTSDPIRDSSLENYTEIDTSDTYVYWLKKFSFATNKDYDTYQKVLTLQVLRVTEDMCTVIYKNEQLQKILLEQSFDLVIVEWHSTPCAYGYSYFLSCPLVGISSTGTYDTGHDSIGNPTNPAYIPNVILPHTDHKTFWEKVSSVWYSIWFRWLWHGTVLPSHDAIARQQFGDSMPYIGDIEKNVSLLILTLDSLSLYTRPNVPAIVEIRALHLQQPKPLPQDLQEFLDGASEGVIYFSLGSNVKSEKMSSEKRQIFLDAFSELLYLRVLWKWEGDELPGQPRNVKVAKWLPQQDVLSHPNIKLFIYQGGLQSTEEAIRACVPVIGIPIFGDQNKIVRNMADFGAGVFLEFNDLNKEMTVDAINEVIYNTTYKENMRELKNRLNDESDNSLDRAIWWIEYVIRHKGAPHLRSAALDLTWFQLLLHDVIVCIILLALFIFCISYRVITLFICQMRYRMCVRYKKD
ncbi:UDP-glycosyltransferase UGT5-like [Periplaneta americana]|uniref:UDP-glycosyltransferase UGT5-like n=1 Tax=Periplaneta americana TaxID=6978 RepID=UPI0037E9227D